ncbi:head GIN domain-containing protein [uncultured Parabacteroides sp.]|uniref:head GIN domain-containing protein n=1 Tax=uncultured Parabacteroides sp. TaxID=512312 RepID=UPI00263691EB|nr:head GIN domain-containing protein [uncultured Parabacteroides sp.]
MKTRLLVAIAFIFCTLAAEASKVKGNGNLITKEISVDNYSEIELGGNIEYSGNNRWGNKGDKQFPIFKYTHGRNASLKITIDENLLSFLSIKSKNGRLSIRIQEGTRIKPTRYVIEGSSKNLRFIKTSGPMDFEAQNAFSEDQLEIKISGSSDVIFPHNVKLRSGEFSVSGSGDLVFENLSCKTLTSKVSGSGDITLRGKADEARYSVSGSGDIKAYDLSANNLSCSVHGSGDARVYAKDNMDLSVSGSGDIRYKGPAKVSKSKSGSGSIQDAN